MHPGPEALTSFKYPYDRLLRLQGVIEEEELRRPQVLNRHGERWLNVIKNGFGTGVTIGRANGAMSFVREYFRDGTHRTSMEWAILAYNHKAGAFSAPGDSGAIIVDGMGRIGGLITGGTGQGEYTDITYATPFYWVLQRIQASFPEAYVYSPAA